MQYGWFLIYYVAIAVLSLWYGSGFIRQPNVLSNYLIQSAKSEKPPRLLLKALRYALIFTVISLVVALYPFSFPEMLFSVVLLGLIFAAGRLLLMWDSIRELLHEKRESLQRLSRKSGLILVLVGITAAMLWYRLLTN